MVLTKKCRLQVNSVLNSLKIWACPCFTRGVHVFRKFFQNNQEILILWNYSQRDISIYLKIFYLYNHEPKLIPLHYNVLIDKTFFTTYNKRINLKILWKSGKIRKNPGKSGNRKIFRKRKSSHHMWEAFHPFCKKSEDLMKFGKIRKKSGNRINFPEKKIIASFWRSKPSIL